MIIYEVNLSILNSRSEEFLIWLKAHIQEMLKLPGFESAHLSQIKESAIPEVGCQSYSVHYFLKDQSALDSYFETHAERMRSEGKMLFKEDFKAERRVLSLMSFLPDKVSP
ncbi:MAG: DUF4286 family protein [Bdellovibrionales bacterium]|nr:DUF4286 family protein [Bdellovibrionales bacterium]